MHYKLNYWFILLFKENSINMGALATKANLYAAIEAGDELAVK